MECYRPYVMLILGLTDVHIDFSYSDSIDQMVIPFLKDAIDIAYEFRQNHPFLSKVPFINWIIYKKIFRNKIQKIIKLYENKYKNE